MFPIGKTPISCLHTNLVPSTPHLVMMNHCAEQNRNGGSLFTNRGYRNAESGNGGPNNSFTNEDFAQNQTQDHECLIALPPTKPASAPTNQQHSIASGTDEILDFNINPIIFTTLMVSNLVGEHDDELFIDSRTCPLNVRYIYMSQLSCLEPKGNLFMRLLEARPCESITSVFDGNFILTLTGLNYQPISKEVLCEECSLLLSTS